MLVNNGTPNRVGDVFYHLPNITKMVQKGKLKISLNDTLEDKLNSDFELIKGLNECADAYRVMPHPTALP